MRANTAPSFPHYTTICDCQYVSPSRGYLVSLRRPKNAMPDTVLESTRRTRSRHETQMDRHSLRSVFGEDCLVILIVRSNTTLTAPSLDQHLAAEHQRTS